MNAWKLKGTLLWLKSIFFILDPISRHNSKTPHVFRLPDFDLKPVKILENVPSPVFTNSPTGIGQNANRSNIGICTFAGI